MKKLTFTLSLIAVAVMAAVPAFAQPGPPPATPIDGGLSILLAMGGAYGIKKIRDSKKNNS